MNDSPPNSPPDGDDRRNFISVVSLVMGAFLGLGPLFVGLFAFLNPLRSRREPPISAIKSSGTGPEGFTRLCALEALGVGDPPQMFQVIGDLQDAWNFTPQQNIGNVYVHRTNQNAVTVFNATCPHAGCTIACEGQTFHCPCHNSSFNVDGEKRQSESGRENPSPRSMDSLVVDVDKLAEGEVWIKFHNFYTGREEKKPKG